MVPRRSPPRCGARVAPSSSAHSPWQRRWPACSSSRSSSSTRWASAACSWRWRPASSRSFPCRRSSTGSAPGSTRSRRSACSRSPPAAAGRGSRPGSCGGPAGWPLVSASVLIVLAIPALRVHFVGVDATTLPASASSRQVAEALEPGGRPWALRPDHRDHGCSTAGVRDRRARGGTRRGRRPAGAAGGARPLAPRHPPARRGARRQLAAARPHRARGATRRARYRADGGVRRPAGIARRAPAVGACDPRAHDLHADLPFHGLRRAAA